MLQPIIMNKRKEEDIQLQEIVDRYHDRIKNIRAEFRKEVQKVLSGLRTKKMSELEEKLGISKRQ